MTDSPVFCRNCRAPLRGNFCCQCGQRHWPNDLSFKDVAGEAVEEVFSWDSRLWRTLVPLLFRPGFLTSEFIAGRRARYVPPFRLYLIISFILFLVLSLLASNADFIRVHPADSVSSPAAVTGNPDVSGSEAGQGDVVIAPVGFGDTDGRSSVSADIGFELSDDDSPQWLKNFEQRLEENAKTLGSDQSEFVSQLVEYMPQIMFILLPAFALLLRVCYLFSPFHYLQHLVFSLHFHSFAYVLYLVGALVSSWVYEAGIGLPLVLISAVYLTLAFMRAYRSSLAGAVGKAIVILLVDAVMLLMAFAFITLLALASL